MKVQDRVSLVQSLLESNLDFHGENSTYASHDFHSFPAKFPPQLPRKFIETLTLPGDTVLDPMAGSGTTVLEAHLQNRIGLGFDIDPLAVLLTHIKIADIDARKALDQGILVLESAKTYVHKGQYELEMELLNKWDDDSREFVDYWFSEDVQLELIALLRSIEKIEEPRYRNFLKLVFSAVIITKSGGVSLAFDLGHTRPHRAKAAVSIAGNFIYGKEIYEKGDARVRFLTKKLRSPIAEFQKRLKKNVESMVEKGTGRRGYMHYGDAQNLPLDEDSIDLIVTSPPYASNAIDYMRAHKFSLVWLGFPIDDLSAKRKEYIGGEAVSQFEYESLPAYSAKIVSEIGQIDTKRGQVLRRYYSEMTKVLREMRRVLKPGGVSVLVVGDSVMRGVSTETAECLAEIGRELGFGVPGIGVRNLDRDRRMLPSNGNNHNGSQIQKRMHEEYVIGFLKP